MSESQRKWISVGIALLAIVLGAFALGNPFWSLEAMPIWLLLTTAMILLWRGPLRHRASIGAIVAIVAVGLLFNREVAVALLVYGAIAYVLVQGAFRITAGRRRDWSTMVSGIAMVLLSFLALYWLDLTSIVIGLAIGPTLIVVGLIALWRIRAGHIPPHPGSGVVLAVGRVGSVLLLAFAIVGAGLTAYAISQAPVADDFADYDGPLGNDPGVLLGFEPYDRSVPDHAVGYRILYTTTGLDGEITLATGLVIAPRNAGDEPLDTILWAHGTTGVNVLCAPSLMTAPLKGDNRQIPSEPLDHGWAIVAPDYLGLGVSAPHPYLVGKPTAHSSLDAVRAAKQLEDISLSDQTVVWGHSQGGGTALWIGIESETYAPDVPILGIAALAPASGLDRFVDHLIDTAAGPIFGGYIVLAYSQVHDDVSISDYIRPGARFSQEMLVERCLAEPSTLVSVLSALIREPFTPGSIHDGALLSRLNENVPLGTIEMPVLILQGLDDPLILPAVQNSYVAAMCDSGQVLEYRTYAGEDHLSVMEPGKQTITDMIFWTQDRFAGNTAPAECVYPEESGTPGM